MFSMKQFHLYLTGFLLLFEVTIINAQRGEYYYFYFNSKQITDYSNVKTVDTCQLLHLNQEFKEFCIGKGNDFCGSIPLSIECMSFGKYYFKNDTLICYDKYLNRIYKFKQLNPYTIEAIKHTAVYVKGTKIYLHVLDSDSVDFRASYYDFGELINSDYWKTGTRDGMFWYWNSSETILRYFQNDVVIDSIIINEEDTMYEIKRNNFLKKYNHYRESDFNSTSIIM